MKVFIFLIAGSTAPLFGCSGSSSGTTGTTPTMTKDQKRTSRYEKIKKSLDDYFLAYGTPGGSDGWNPRFQSFIKTIDTETNTDRKILFENTLGRVVQDLNMRQVRSKVGASPASVFSFFVHKLMGVCRALDYLALIRSSTDFPSKGAFITEYNTFIDDSLYGLTADSNQFHPGERLTSFGNTVGIMQKIGCDSLGKMKEPCEDSVQEKTLRLATDIYELHQLRNVPNRALNGKFTRNDLNALDKLLMNCRRHDATLPGLYEAVVDKCYTGLVAYAAGLANLYETGLIGPGTVAQDQFDFVGKTVKEILAEGTRIATELDARDKSSD